VTYNRIDPKFWTDPDVAGWSDDAKLLALYLMTCPHRTTEGLFRLPKPYAQADLQWSAERLAEPFAELLADRSGQPGFIAYDERAQVVLIRNAMKYQAPQNDNQVTAALRGLEALPPTFLTCEFRRLAERFCERLAKRLPEGFGQPIPDPPAPTPAPTPEKLSVDGGAVDAEADPPSEPAEHPDAQRLCDMLADAIQANTGERPYTGRPGKAWLGAARLLLTRDGPEKKGYSSEQVEYLIRWSQGHHHWSSRVTSMAKLRENRYALIAQAKSSNNGRRPLAVTADGFTEYEASGRVAL